MCLSRSHRKVTQSGGGSAPPERRVACHPHGERDRDRDRWAEQALRQGPGRVGHVLRGRRGPRDRLPGAERGGQVNDPAHAARPDPGRPRHRHLRRQALRGARSSQHARGRRARERIVSPRALGAQPSARARRRGRAPAGARDRAARAGGPHRGGGPARQGLLDGHAPAARDRGRAARRPRGADPRRAHQRARPARHPLGPRPAARPGRPRARGARVEPPALRGGAERRRRGRDRAGA